MIGLGFKGDIISVTKRLARNHMLPAGVAEYVTEENLKKYDHIRTVVYITRGFFTAMRYINRHYLSIYLV